MIWLLVVIPVLIVLVLYIGWGRKIHPGEAALLLAAPILFLWASSFAVESARTAATEYLGGYVQNATYYEEWNEYIHKTCTRCISHDKNGSCTSEISYDCSYVEDHPPYWQLSTTLGSFNTDANTYQRLVTQFSDKVFVAMHHPYYTKNGDAYATRWQGEPLRIEPVTIEHTYENRIQVSNSVLRYQKVDPKTYGLFEHPPLYGLKQNAILGPAVPDKEKAEQQLAYWNAILGGSKQARIFILIFQGKPLQAAFDQQAYWQGGNKNELVIAVGIDKSFAPQWCHVFSWSEREDLKIAARETLAGQKKLDLVAFVDWLGPEVQKRWARRHFREFSYLRIQPPLWYVITALVVVLALSIGIGWWVVSNDIQIEGESNDQESKDYAGNIWRTPTRSRSPRRGYRP